MSRGAVAGEYKACCIGTYGWFYLFAMPTKETERLLMNVPNKHQNAVDMLWRETESVWYGS